MFIHVFVLAETFTQLCNFGKLSRASLLKRLDALCITGRACCYSLLQGIH